MNFIYKKAAQVMVWLSPAADDSDLLMFWKKSRSTEKW
jgi:hypothetical protein